MGNFRIQNIKPPCRYLTEGLDTILLLDLEDFNGFGFKDQGLYDSCLVTKIFKSGSPAEVEASESAKYSATLQNGIYTHTLEAFIDDLSAETAATLHLATKRRYVVFFRAKNSLYFSFAYEAGAKVTYTNQTAEGVGSLFTVAAASIYPLFEVSREAFASLTDDGGLIPT